MTRYAFIACILALLGSIGIAGSALGQQATTPAKMPCEMPLKRYGPMVDTLLPIHVQTGRDQAFNYSIVLRSTDGLLKEWQIVIVSRGTTLEVTESTVGEQSKSIWEAVSYPISHEGACLTDEEIKSQVKIVTRDLKPAPADLSNLLSELFTRQLNLQLETSMKPGAPANVHDLYVEDGYDYDLWVSGLFHSVHFNFGEGYVADTSKWLVDWILRVKKVVDQAK